ncbi:MAG: choline dehydrogenase [Mesorhizobium sp.]|uniref:choline dehydrogenase n=1 Tax=Mesorhizobium sp. TaxID=1871066 RepID=UPI000FE72369|nr:choline dehydrogenase [Mesorhizobium sp.]RWM88730.1 MAG: choline dehydrogenase [Mesorhizobium sp.]
MQSSKYDYVVIGAGAAGSVVAARLGEDTGTRVLVVEAGPHDNSIYVRMPAAMSYPLTDKRRIWEFETGPEAALDGRMITHVRGKMLGGSGSLNGMVYVRGNPRDFDRWAEDGLTNWSYAHCLPYFKKLEKYDRGADGYRGGDGPIAITSLKAELEPFQAFLEAGQQAGHPLNRDYNAFRQEGVHAYQANIDNGIRASGGRAYLRPAVRKGNVSLHLNALVHKVAFNGKRAVGVVYEKDGVLHTAEAEREIILCGGAFNSPQILQLSGVGAARELEAAGVKPVHDLPGVGKGLQDHVAVSVKYRASRKGVSPAVDMNILKMAWIGAQWMFLRKGLGITNLWEVGSFFKSSDRVDYANIQHEFLPMLGELMHGQVNIEEGFQYQVCLGRPNSKGRVSLKSADPREHPSIVLNYLQDPEDRRNLIDGVRHTDEIIQQRGWDRIRGEAIVPGLRNMDDGQVFAWLRKNMGTQYHPCSSCRMGFDDEAVVDEQGRVHGLEAIRVVDASVMPRITNGNLHCPTMMIAEKITDAIRGIAPLQPTPQPYADQVS